MEIYRVSRKSRALGTGIPRCVSGTGTYSLNVVRGCLMACAYCSYRALPSSPADDELYIYQDLAEQLREELDRMDRSGHRPRMVLVNTGCDCFLGLAEVDRIVTDCIATLLKRRIPVQITSKGVLPRDLVALLGRHRDLVQIQMPIPAVSKEFYARFEPNAPGLEGRLDMLRVLTAAGLDVRVRIEPLIPMENDSERDLKEVLRTVYRIGVRRVFAAFLQMRVGVEKRLAGRVGPIHTSLIAQWYRREVPSRRPLREDPGQRTSILPDRAHRLEAYQILHEQARALGMGMSICACRNPDITGGACYSIPAGAPGGLRPKKQLDLL